MPSPEYLWAASLWLFPKRGRLVMVVAAIALIVLCSLVIFPAGSSPGNNKWITPNTALLLSIFLGVTTLFLPWFGFHGRFVARGGEAFAGTPTFYLWYDPCLNWFLDHLPAPPASQIRVILDAGRAAQISLAGMWLLAGVWGRKSSRLSNRLRLVAFVLLAFFLMAACLFFGGYYMITCGFVTDAVFERLHFVWQTLILFLMSLTFVLGSIVSLRRA